MVALHEGRPFVTAGGVVELWHRACFESRDVPLPAAAEVAPPAPPARRLRPAWIGAATAAALVAVLLGRWASADGGAAPVAVVVHEVASHEPIAMQDTFTAPEVLPPRAEITLEERYPIPDLDGETLDALYPSLRAWIHPVTASHERMPARASRLFGAVRAGIERPECGSGHCGVDLDGPRGRPLVAVAAGKVVRVERRERGLDGRSGRYVRIEHDDGTLTAYMHMDDVAEELKVGDRVDAGEYIGTLGATAVFSAPPHLHFSLEVPRANGGGRGDHTQTYYVDPAPFLARATIVPAIERREPKAAF